ncbi:MAG: cytochrome D1 [Gammaproteobacteria bacterium]|nr:cytochrome D1 [Gammaproteobacteria bacterium]
MQLSWNRFVTGAFLALSVSVQPAYSASDTQTTESESPPATQGEAGAVAEPAEPNRITREGVIIEFSARPTSGESDTMMAADWADVSFRITDAETGEPIKGRYPAAWMDLAAAWEAKGERPMSCKDKVQTYLQGIVGVRPMIDLNSHFLLVMNRAASISVIDPAVGITGITNLFAQINLDQPGADWAKTEDQKRLFISMPLAKQVALVDTETFKVSENVDVGEYPIRVKLQNDERYLWVGNDAPNAEASGVTVIDTAELEQVAFIATGQGHHEIAFTDDDRYAFVSNRDTGTVSVIDVQSLKKVKDIETGPVPIALGFSPLGKALYVADGKSGEIIVVDTASLEIRARIEAKPGLGPLRFSQDGRWGLVVNPIENAVFVIDASLDRLAHTISVGSQPYQVNFTRGFGYVRSLGTQDVGLIPVSELDSATTPPVTYIPAGQNPPGIAADISIADSIVPSVKQAAAYIVNQAEGTVHYYMEGMAAPMGAFRNYGHEARAIEIVDRSLSEREPGVYIGRVKIPVEGVYDIAFMMDTPRFLHCFSAAVEPNPEFESTTAQMAVEYQIGERRVPVGATTTVKFKLTDPRTGLPRGDIPDVTVLYYGADGRGRRVVPARALGAGLYEADVNVNRLITYYVFVGSRSEKLSYSDLPFASVRGIPAPAKAQDAVPPLKAEEKS